MVKYMLLFLGIDGLGPNVLKNMYKEYLPFLNMLSEKYWYSEIKVADACSPKLWTEMFSGTYLSWYRIYITPGDVVNGVQRWRLVRRDELPVKFIWEEKPNVVVINAPVLTPPVCLNTAFEPVAYGFPMALTEWIREISGVEKHTLAAINNNRNVISVITSLDRALHVTAVKLEVKTVLTRIDKAVERIISKAEEKGYKWIIASDHDMYRVSKEEKAIVTKHPDLPYLPSLQTYIHRHDNTALAITNIGRKLRSHKEIYLAIKENV